MKPVISILSICLWMLLPSCNTKNQVPDESAASHDHSLQEQKYVCPMHPDVKGHKGDICPKCGMKLESVTSKNNISMTINSIPEIIESGKNITLLFNPTDQSGNPVVLEEIHERKLHVIAVNEDLSWFDHIHAEPDDKGVYRIAETFPAGGHYFVYADYKPKNHEPRTDKFEIHVAGEPGKIAELYPGFTAVTDGYTLSITNHRVETGSLELPITIEKDGKLVKRQEIENYLGAVAHIILIHQNDKDFIHIHPESTDQYPIVAHANISKSGMYRMWVQFQTNGTLHTADFTVDVNSSLGNQKDQSSHHDAHRH